MTRLHPGNAFTFLKYMPNIGANNTAIKVIVNPEM
jgi:hypothetical protein